MDTLIAELASAAGSHKASPWRSLLQWAVPATVSVAALLWLLGVRADLTARLEDPVFITELLLLAALSLSSGIAAIWLSYPDIRQQSYVLYPPPILLGALLAFYLWQLFQNPIAMPAMDGMECVVCILMFGALPTVLALLLMRRNGTTHPRKGAMAALLAALSLGCLGIRLCEPQENVTHVLTWHYGPMVFFTLLCVFFGRRLLRW